jgi:hypothetical protein
MCTWSYELSFNRFWNITLAYKIIHNLYVVVFSLRGGFEFHMALSVDKTRKGSAKLNQLKEIERKVQERWAKERIFEVDAPKPGSAEAK